MFSSPKVFESTLQLPYPSREQWRRLTETDDGTYDLVTVIGDSVVGMVSVHTLPKSPRRRNIGVIDIVVHAEWQGKGVGKALMRAGIVLADNWLNLTRLELEVYADNESAVRLYERSSLSVMGRSDSMRSAMVIMSIRT